MLSYQHSFHAGNHADVLKHIVLCAIIKQLHKKSKPFYYADSHAGNGCYKVKKSVNHNNNLNNYDEVSAYSLLNSKSLPACLKDYKCVISPFLQNNTYPGSPAIALAMIEHCRKQWTDKQLIETKPNKLQLNELHPSAFKDLNAYCHNYRVHVQQRDAFEFLHACLPPKPNRGLVLIDPPYEQVQEYEDVFNAIQKSLKKWPNGMFAIWYPLLSPTRLNRRTQQIEDNPKHGLSEVMREKIASIATTGLLDIRFAMQEASANVGMYGSGMLVVNPPWQLDEQMRSALDYLIKHIQKDNNKVSGIQFLVPVA